MYVDAEINPIVSPSLQGDLAKGRKFAEKFRDILWRTMTSRSNSRPPKIELFGLLIPCYQEFQGQLYRYKLGTETAEYLLSISEDLSRIAKIAEWEEVSIRGFHEPGTKIVEVEKIMLKEVNEPSPAAASIRETPFDLEIIESAILKRGKIEPALEFEAS